MKFYKVQAHRDSLGWRNVPFAESRTQAYCDGWVDCMDSMYPSPPMRIVRVDTASDRDAAAAFNVVRETRGRAKPHLNSR